MNNDGSDGGYGYGAYGAIQGRESWSQPTFQRYVSILRRHIWWILTVVLVFGTVGILRAYKAVPIYEAVAKILVERQGPRVTKFEDVVQPNVEWWGQEYYKTQEELVQSRAVMDIALEQPGIRELFTADVSAAEPQRKPFTASIRDTFTALLGIPPVAPPEIWERLRAQVRGKHMLDTHFIAIRVSGSDPERCAKIANAVARAFIRYHMLRRMEISNEVFLYLQEQKLKEEKALQQAEEKLQKFREETNISSLDSTDKEHPVLKRLSLLNSQMTDKQLQRIAIEAQCRVIKQALDVGTETIRAENEKLFSIPAMTEDQTVAELRTALVTAESEKSSLAEVYGPEHPRMQAAISKIEVLQTQLTEAMQNIANSLLTRQQMLEEEEKSLSVQYDEQNTLALDLAKSSVAFQRIENEVERHQKLYQVLVERMSEVQLSSDYTKTNVDVTEQASVPKVPIAPNKQRMALMSLLFGLVLGIGLAVFLEQIDDTVRTPEDMELRVGVPVLGFVPEIQINKRVESKTAYRALITVTEPNSSAIEAYRNIRTNLFFSGAPDKNRLLLITSGGPGDGKTTTACNLAIIIAQSGKRVLLIDADFRRPRVHKVFGLDATIGLSNVLAGTHDYTQAIQKTVHDIQLIENLDLMAAGPTPPNPTELIESDTTRKFLEELREKYDRIIIDTPPVLFVSDTSILSTLVDGVILVVKSDRRKRAHAARARMQIEKVKGRILGGILNNVKVARFGYYYSDYYYHGYARYQNNYYSSYYAQKEDQPNKKSPEKSIEV